MNGTGPSPDSLSTDRPGARLVEGIALETDESNRS
jgi:hypothetical protein